MVLAPSGVIQSDCAETSWLTSRGAVWRGSRYSVVSVKQTSASSSFSLGVNKVRADERRRAADDHVSL